MEFRLESIRRFLILLLYIGCLVGGLIFSLDTIKQYLSFNTSFLIMKEPLLVEDVPFITICYQKGEYPNITGTVSNSISSSWDLDITEVAGFRTMAGFMTVRISCWKIELRSREGLLDSREVGFGTSVIYQLSITSPKKNISNTMEYQLYLTSKGNSYGIGRNAWYDGEVAKGRIEAGYAHTIRITDVINTRSIQHCSPNPFYEILANEYISSNLTKYSHLYQVILPNGKKEKRKCDYTEFCLPISLPSDFPLCNTSTPELENMISLCHFQALKGVENDLINKKQQIRQHKVCNMMEYKYTISSSRKLKNHIERNDVLLMIKIKAPRFTNREWSKSVPKTINQEYYIMDGKAFVGIIGGTLGLFVGLSFMDISNLSVDLIIKLIACKLMRSESN